MSWRSRLSTLVLAPSATVGIFHLTQSGEGRHSHQNRPVVHAKRKTAEDVALSNPKMKRFEDFSTIQINGEFFMTPADFLESVTEARPRKSAYRISYSVTEITESLRRCTPKAGTLVRGDTQFFRKLGNRGIISYNEYLFLLCIITKPKQGFDVAFKMFDTDGSQTIDYDEFKMLESIFRSSSENVAKNQRNVEAGFGTTLAHFFFGEDKKHEITHEQFYDFMHNLQSESRNNNQYSNKTLLFSVLELEFNAFARGKWEITELEFAEMLLRYTDVWDMESQLEVIGNRIKNTTGISLDEFKAFFFFLNNLENFATAIHLYALAKQEIGPLEFMRAVEISTGEILSENLVRTVYAIFDKDGNQMLSHKEFIGVMTDRLNRQNRTTDTAGLTYLTKTRDRSPWETMRHCYTQKQKAEE